MKKIDINFLLIIYLLIFEFIVFFPSYATSLMLLLTIINIISTIINKKIWIFTLFSSFIMCNEMIALINCLSVLFTSTRMHKKGKKDIRIGLFVLVIFMNSIISAVISDTYINVIFSVCYLLLITIIYSKMKNNIIDEEELKKYLKKIIIIEFFVFISLLFKNGLFIPGDSNFGTLMNAHLFGNFLIIIIFYLIGNNNILHNIKKNIVYILLCLIMLYYSDSKSLITSVIILLIMSPIIMMNHKSNKKPIFKFIIILYIFLYLLIPVVKNESVKKFVYNNAGNEYIYIYDNDYNYKFKYFDGTLYNELTNYRFFIGFGLGQYGSRFSNLFTYDVSYRTDNFLNRFVEENFSPHYNQNYVKYISFYNSDFVEGIHWRSAILSYPFNSIIAILGEIGWIGLILFSLYIDKMYNESKYKYIIYYFIISCLFDNYFDMFQSIGLMMFFMSIRDNIEIEKDKIINN